MRWVNRQTEQRWFEEGKVYIRSEEQEDPHKKLVDRAETMTNTNMKHI